MNSENIETIVHDSNNQLQSLSSLIYLNKAELGAHFNRINGIITSLSNKNFNLRLISNNDVTFNLKKEPASVLKFDLNKLIDSAEGAYYPIIVESEILNTKNNIQYNPLVFKNIIFNIFDMNEKLHTSCLYINLSFNNSGVILKFKSEASYTNLPSDTYMKMLSLMCKKCGYLLKFKFEENKNFKILLTIPTA